jgi:hypothetical protein
VTGFRSLVAGLVVGPLLVSLAVLQGCYATNGPKPPSCSAVPNQPGCFPPIHDMRGGR